MSDPVVIIITKDSKKADWRHLNSFFTSLTDTTARRQQRRMKPNLSQATEAKAKAKRPGTCRGATDRSSMSALDTYLMGLDCPICMAACANIVGPNSALPGAESR